VNNKGRYHQEPRHGDPRHNHFAKMPVFAQAVRESAPNFTLRVFTRAVLANRPTYPIAPLVLATYSATSASEPKLLGMDALPQTVLPMTTLPITELEEIEGHLHDHKMGEIIESFQESLRRDTKTIFLGRMLPILRGQSRKTGSTLRRFDTYLTQFEHRLFPNEPRG